MAAPMTRPCHPAQHRWRLATCLPLTLPDIDGWVRVLLQRICRVCEDMEWWVGACHIHAEKEPLKEEDICTL